jgi:hypothetical protein
MRRSLALMLGLVLTQEPVVDQTGSQAVGEGLAQYRAAARPASNEHSRNAAISWQFQTPNMA